MPSDSSKDYYYMLRNTPNTEAIIVEYGFLDNTSDANRLKNNYKDYAEAVVRAVAEYKNLNYIPLTGSDYYIVKKGDTLWSIARDNNISVAELKAINNLTSNSLSIGDILKLSNETIETPSSGNTYTVKSGDTLYSIARKYNITVNELKTLNNLTSNTLSIGQILTIPTDDQDQTPPVIGNTYTVKSGDTLYSIARKYNVSVNDLKNANNLTSNTLSINQELVIPGNSTNNETYIVKSGDTLYSIARKFNVSVNDIKSLNNLSTTLLSIGQTLLIPN